MKVPPGIHLIGSWIGPRTGSHILEKRKSAIPSEKGKAWTGPEGSRRLGLPNCMTIDK